MCKHSAKMNPGSQDRFGWIQINNAVSPYVQRRTAGRDAQRLVPFLVLTEGARLKFTRIPDLVSATEPERGTLNSMCTRARFQVTFADPTKMVSIEDVFLYSSSAVLIKQLPLDNPLGNAQAQPEVGDNGHIPRVDSPITPDKIILPGHPHTLVPTVVADFYSGEAMSQGEPGASRDTDRPQTSRAASRLTNPTQYPLSAEDFRCLYIKGLQYVTLFHTQLLCFVKDEKHYVPMVDLHKSFFSKWPFSSFSFSMLSILHCQTYQLNSTDIATIRRLSGDSPSGVNVVSLSDAKGMLPKVKVLLRKIPGHLQSHMIKFAAHRKASEDKRLPRLSLILESGNDDSDSVSKTTGAGIGAKFGGGQSSSSSSTCSKPTSKLSSSIPVKRLLAERRKRAVTEASVTRSPPGVGASEGGFASDGHQNLTSPANYGSCDVNTGLETAQPPQNINKAERGSKLQAVLNKLTKTNS